MKTALSTSKTKNIFAILLTDFTQLTKARLSVSVVFSSLAGYFLGAERIEYKVVLLLAVGGYFMVGASNTFNQIIEKDLDALMKRTRNRPIPAGRISVNIAFVVAVLLTFLGVVTLYSVNPKTAMFSAISVFLYTSLYTPLKTKTPLSVFVGAFPGAIPFMLGWVAATNSFGIEPGTLFMIQFFWQFPHFWAIGWLLDDDYKKAGFKLLPTGEKYKKTAIHIIVYTLWVILIAVFPATGLTGKLELSIPAAMLIFALGLFMLMAAFRLYKERDNVAARYLMLISVSYLTLIQIVYVIDKFLR